MVQIMITSRVYIITLWVHDNTVVMVNINIFCKKKTLELSDSLRLHSSGFQFEHFGFILTIRTIHLIKQTWHLWNIIREMYPLNAKALVTIESLKMW